MVCTNSTSNARHKEDKYEILQRVTTLPGQEVWQTNMQSLPISEYMRCFSSEFLNFCFRFAERHHIELEVFYLMKNNTINFNIFGILYLTCQLK
jgi:hypothetical protein